MSVQHNPWRVQALKADALLAEQDPQALVADVIDHPLGHQELGRLARLQVENGRSCSAGLDLAISLISRRWAQRELRRMAALVFRVERPEPVGVTRLPEDRGTVPGGRPDRAGSAGTLRPGTAVAQPTPYLPVRHRKRDRPTSTSRPTWPLNSVTGLSTETCCLQRLPARSRVPRW